MKRKTPKQYKQECINMGLDLPVEDYVNNKTKIKHKCQKCNAIYSQRPDHHLKGNGCKRCALEYTATLTRISKTRHEYELYCKKHGYDLPLSGFTKSSDYIEFRCNNCGKLYTQRVSSHNSGCSCQICANKKNNSYRNSLKTRKQYRQYIKECEYRNLDPPIEDYVNSNTKINHKCRKGHVYPQLPSSHLSGVGCPICKESKGERFIRTYLDKHNIKYIPQKRFKDLKDKTYLSYDFYLPNYNILIEYQGTQHYSQNEYFGGIKGFKKQQYHDKLKREYAKNNGYKLLELHYSLDTQDKINKYLEIKIK